jgi:predicted lactoylglutathione lyase
MQKQIFVNLPVMDLARSMEFFKSLGFSFNPQFTNEQAGCLVIEEGSIYVMLITEPFFKGFIPAHEQADAGKVKEVLTCISLESRATVDEMLGKAVAAGGREYRPAEDHGWMYSRSFTDLDNHVWEIMYGDASAAPATPEVPQA